MSVSSISGQLKKPLLKASVSTVMIADYRQKVKLKNFFIDKYFCSFIDLNLLFGEFIRAKMEVIRNYY